MHQPLVAPYTIMMATALTLFTRQTMTTTMSSSRPAILQGVMGWSSSSSSFVPLTSSRQNMLGYGGGSTNSYMTKRTMTSSMVLTKRSNLVMWGEEDAPRRPPTRDAIPSSKFSSESSNSRPPPARRPARRSGQNSSDGGGWYDDDKDDNRRPARSSPRTQSSGGWDDGGDDWFGNDDSSSGGGGGQGGYEPYVYDKRPSNNRGNRGRGARERDGGRGRGRGRGGRDSYRSRGGGGDRGGGRYERGGGERDFRRPDSRARAEGGRGGRGRGRGGDRDGRNKSENDAGAVKTNLRMIENAGYRHLYGIAPVLNALKAGVRDFASPKDESEKDAEDLMELRSRLSNVDGIDDDDDDDDGFSMAYDDENNDDRPAKKKIIKPEAMLCPHLFVQEGTLDNSKRSFRSHDKNEASAEILQLAREKALPVAEVDKGVLNTLCGNRPHQGFVLRCGGLDFQPVRGLPSSKDGKKGGPELWLALDEVVDPQNLGALLRSAYFLGSGPGIISDENDALSGARGGGKVGILVCSKNSSPLTPTVSAASAGALEFMTIYSTSNLPKLLSGAKEDGWRILGAAAEVPDGARDYSSASASAPASTAEDNSWDLESDDGEAGSGVEDDKDVGQNAQQQQQQQCLDLHKVKAGSPTILVLGSEGRGLRTLVARACTGFVSVPGAGGTGATDEDADKTQAGVDSLNVSVTGGILLWHFLSSKL